MNRLEHHQGRSGFTLLGVMVALFILVTAAVASFTLMARTQKTVSISRDSFVAVNLAREGIELVRAVRDTNWFQGTTWTEGLCESDEIERVAVDFDRSIDAQINVIQDPTKAQTRLFTLNNHWSHFEASNSEPTRFRREMILFCANHLAEDDDPDSPNKLVVTARVFWDRDGREESLVLRTRFYDWYQ